MSVRYKLNVEDGEDIVYINIQATNQGTNFEPMNFSISRTSYLIRNPQEYQMSLVRFQIPTLTLPLWFFNPSIDYKVTLGFNGAFASQNLIYVNTNTASNYPFGVWSYTDLCDMINTAILSAFNVIKLEPGFTATFPPYIQYETALKCFSIIGDDKYIDVFDYKSPTVPHLYFNQNLFGLFNNFKSLNYPIQPNGRDNLIVIANESNNKIITRNAIAGVIMTQEFSTTYLINSLSSVAITSNDLPISSLSQAQIPLGSNVTQGTYLQLVEDFQPILSSAETTGDQRSILLYQPSIFRYINMLGSAEIKSMNLQFYAYQADVNRYQIIYLGPQQYISLRLMFKRKSLNF